MNKDATIKEGLIGLIVSVITTLIVVKLYMMVFRYAYNEFFKNIFLIDITNEYLLALVILSIIISIITTQSYSSLVENDKSYFEKLFLSLFYQVIAPLYLLLILWMVSFFYL